VHGCTAVRALALNGVTPGDWPRTAECTRARALTQGSTIHGESVTIAAFSHAGPVNNNDIKAAIVNNNAEGLPEGSFVKSVQDAWNSFMSGCDQQCKDTCCRNGGGAACISACGCSGACSTKTVGGCDQQCKDTCCRNGGGAACISACGCSGACSTKAVGGCDQQCKDTCCRNGGGAACISACGCSGACSNTQFDALLTRWNRVVDQTNGGCGKPGACGLAYQGCCFGAGHSGDACTCKLTDGSGEVGTTCSGTDKAGACGLAYTACCIGYKAKGDPCTCDVEAP